MVSRVYSSCFNGIEVLEVGVEVSISSSLPSFQIVGLATKAVDESKERVRSALTAIGISFPAKKITVNLAPADLPKEGSHFDLPIACGILVEMGVLPREKLENYVILGELSLDGRVSAANGVLPSAMMAMNGGKGIICPEKQGPEAVWAGLEDIVAVPDLTALIGFFTGRITLEKPRVKVSGDDRVFGCLSEIKGQETAKRALEIAAAGGHNMLMIGPPGSGKSMLAARMLSVMPPLNNKEILDVSMIYSVAGLLEDGRLMSHRPFRTPHHTASSPALIGGGRKAKPGEISLAHNGVLFLDELPEFSRSVLETLRQPMETGEVSIARAENHVSYPARFQLIAAMNPCKCGYLGYGGRQCAKAPRCAEEYQSRISGPLFDRIDIHIEVGEVSPWDLSAKEKSGETSAQVAKRVRQAIDIQDRRFDSHPVSRNAQADGKLLEDIAPLDDGAKAYLADTAQKMQLSARGYFRVLRVARTIADLAGEERIALPHLAEAVSFRRIIHRRSA